MQKCKKMDKERDLHREKSKREKTNPSHSLMEPHCDIKSFSSSTQSENFTKNYSVDLVGFIFHPPVRFLNASVTSSSDLTGKKRKTNAFSSSSKCYVCIWFASSLRRWAFVENTLHLGARKSKYYSKILPHLSSLWLSSDKYTFWTWGLAEDLFFWRICGEKKNLYNNNLLRVSEIHQGGNIAGAQTTRWMLNVNYLLTTGQI